MKSIWYFVGALLTTLGTIITISAIYSLMNPPADQKILSRLHPDLWWGIIMLAFGLAFGLLNRRVTV
jgi:hypothetical protein